MKKEGEWTNLFSEKMIYKEGDREALKILSDFLPDKIFDAHAHIYDKSFAPSIEGVSLDFDKYKEEMSVVLGEPKTLGANLIVFPEKSQAGKDSETLKISDAFLTRELNKHPECVGEIIVRPDDTAEQLEKRLVHKNIKGFKCYHVMAERKDTWNAEIGEYLPESAFEVAEKFGIVITLHMVKDKALYDEGTLKYIREMSKRYPSAKLILAHAARSFASWTGVESVERVADLPNVWFDFSAVCESPAMFMIIKKCGIERCMWGSDYPVCRPRGKAISLADGFYWIYQSDLDNFKSKTPISDWPIAVEGLMATRQACLMAGLNRKDVEDLFYNNAVKLWNL